jgi:hypothetical protein
MILSALFMFCMGALLTFAPGELIHLAGGTQSPPLVLAAQVGGALYLGFAMLNWMAKDNLIGGIYSRPVAMGNFLHFVLVAIGFLKAFSSLPRSAVTVGLILIYCLLAIGFGLVLFQHPKQA